MNIITVNKLDLCDMTGFIAEVKGITYEEAERVIPAVWYEPEMVFHTEHTPDEDWSKELREELKDRGIDRVELYQDC